MSRASSSTTSLVSNTTVSSRTPLNGVPRKDFQSAFADLQSTYGFGGAAPRPVPKKTSTSVPRSTVPSQTTRSPLQTTPKNFESAFADLQSTYGFGGATPSPIPKSVKQPRKGSSSFFSKFTRSPKLQAPSTSPS
ncbi:hypothetical protein B0H12DRAFT_589814 [Mycena haematopus]|nr:hypothetical protein B0H12DRAFT_589814 [Mycena haematopus]